jgi:type VI secretion system secreted protein Hcp
MIFMLHGGISQGTGKTDSHQGSAGWMELKGLQWGAGRGVKNSGGNRTGDSVSVSEVVVTKELDAASYRLFEEATGGQGQQATIHFTQTNANNGEDTYMEYVLEDCLITGFSVGSNGDRPQETISINFTKIHFKPTELDTTNTGSGGPKAVYDIAGKKKL